VTEVLGVSGVIDEPSVASTLQPDWVTLETLPMMLPMRLIVACDVLLFVAEIEAALEGVVVEVEEAGVAAGAVLPDRDGWRLRR